MTALAIREKLYDFIRVADDKKVKAIYMMLEDNIVEELEWWNDIQFTQDLDKRYEDWKTGKDKGYSMEEVNMSIDLLMQKRASK